MVVSCQKCRTRFQLDEARIPAKGVRVRCSKCKHAFFVAPPGGKDDTIHGLAQEAAARGRPSKAKPGPTHDLPGPGGGEPEDDWQFNIDPPGGRQGDLSDSDFDEAAAPPAEITDSEPTENESGFFELDGLSDPGPERSNEAPAAAAAAPADPAPAAAKPGKKTRPAAPPPIEPEQEVTFEDLGRPESWDFGVAEPARPAPAPAATKPAKSAKSAKKKAAGSPAAVAETVPATPRAGAARSTRAGSFAGTLGGAAGWLLALALFGFGLGGALRSPPASGELAAVSIGKLELAGLRVRHVENLFAGPLVVLSGELRNPGSETVRSGVAPRVRITDARGEVLDGALGWVGLGVSPDELRGSEPSALAETLARSARELAERSFAPQDRVSVTAVLGELPPGAAAFRIEAAAPAALPATLASPPVPEPTAAPSDDVAPPPTDAAAP